MPALFSSDEIEEYLRSMLAKAGFALSAHRTHGQTGPDLVATRGADKYAIEIIAFKSSPSARAKDFYEVFFRAVSRLNQHPTKCVVALPYRFGEGLPQRAKQHGEAWERIGKIFPELEIWLVQADSIEYTKWADWLQR